MMVTSFGDASANDTSVRGAVGPYLRATVMSSRRALDVVLPTDQVVADLMPELLKVMGLDTASSTEASSCVLHTPTGYVIDPERPLSWATLVDGVVLRLVAEQEAPAEPIVSDLLDLLESEAPHGRWTAEASQWTLACAGMSVLGFAAGLWVVSTDAATWPRLVIVAIVAFALSAVSAFVGRRAVSWVGCAAGVLAAGLGVGLGAPTVAVAGAWGCAVVLCALAATGWCHGKWRSTLTAALTWLGLVGVAGLSWWSGANLGFICAIVATASSLTLGMLPRAALGLTGLFSNDAQVASGGVVSRRDARTAVDQAHHALAGAVAACALGYGGSGCVLAMTADVNPWMLALLGATLVSWLARTRHFPLTRQRVAICSAVVVVAGGLAFGVVAADVDLRGWVTLICAGVGSCLLAAGSLKVSPVAAAVIRRWVQRFETMAVIATVPCLIGLLGVYADLLETF